jgi:hypothetical protein
MSVCVLFTGPHRGDARPTAATGSPSVAGGVEPLADLPGG